MPDISRTPKSLFLLFALTSMALLFVACSEDPSDPDDGDDGDTTAPSVTEMVPGDGDLVFDFSQQVEIQFNEDMDSESAEGNITLSHGTITNYFWISPNRLNVIHSEWPEATDITVTVGTGLLDISGNNLGSAVTATFTTSTSQLALIGISPDDGSTDVNRNTNIGLGFTEPVIGLESGVTISDGTRIDYSYDVTNLDDGNYTLSLHDILPAETEMTVTIGTDFYGEYTYTSLESAHSFSFTTGLDLDTTPPTIVSITPASGSIIPVDQGTVVVEFSEPVNLNDFTPPSMNGQFAWALEQGGLEPELNGDGTQLTIYLPAILPAGLSLEVVLANYPDVYDNMQTEETAWSATVAGTEAAYYLEDGFRWTTSGPYEEGDLGNPTPTHTEYYTNFYEFHERSAANQWELVEYDWEWSELDFYDIFYITANEISMLGFADDEGSGFQEYLLTSPLVLFELPFSTSNTWTSSSSVTLPEGTISAVRSGEVIGQVDLEVGEQDGSLVTWTDAWKVDLEATFSGGGEVLQASNAQFWVVPGIGVVRELDYSEYFEDGDTGWERSDLWRDLDGYDRK
ncbi:MAG: Ig-like domain-containing protein [bacterium]|nr:Ig-like domain-containing protein [bacterium]